MYYDLNIKKVEALSLIEELILHFPNDCKYKMFKAIILIWSRQIRAYEQLRNEVFNELVTTRSESLKFFLHEIVIHDLSDYVLSEFESGTYGDYLNKHYQYVYYAAIYFSQPDDSRLEHIPEAINDQYEECVSEVEKARAFYAS